MIKKWGFVLLFFSFLKASYIVEIKSSDYQKLHNLGIECIKYNQKIYLCNKSNDKDQLKRFVLFVKKNGVNARITKIINKNLINIYSIQILSTKNLTQAKEYFKKYEKFPYARIEHIGKYYTIRIEASKNQKTLKKVLKKLNNKKAFIRVADIKINRIIEANFVFENKNIKKFNTQNNFLKKNIILTDKSNNKKKFLDNKITQKSIKIINYKKSCDSYALLYIIKKNPKYMTLRNETCYKYYINNVKTSHYDINKIFAMQKAIKYKKNEKDLIALNYLKAKNFQPVNIKFLNSLNVSLISNKFYHKYLKTLLYAGDIQKIRLVCNKRVDMMCNVLDSCFKEENIKTNDKDIKEFNNFIDNIQKNIKNNKLKQAEKNINKLFIINKNNIFALMYAFELNVKRNNFSEVDKLLRNIKVFGIKNNNFSKFVKEAKKYEELNVVKTDFEEGNLNKAQKEIAFLIYRYPNDFDVNILAGDIFENKETDMSNVYYHKAYVINEKKFFYHLLERKDYKRLATYMDKSLKNYPYVLAKVYIHMSKKYLKQKDYESALNYALKSYKLFNSSESSVILGKIYFMMKDYKNCIKYLKGLNKNNYLTYYLGYSYYKIGNVIEAKKYFSKLLNTKDKYLRNKLITVYLEMGEKEKVDKLLNSL